MTIPAAPRRSSDEEDPVENMLKKTGCIDLHYKVQECIAENQDWRKCQDQVSQFRECMNRHQRQRQPNIAIAK